MKAFATITLLLTLSTQHATAQKSSREVQAELATAQRIQVISESDVWEKPSWMDADLKIAADYNVKTAPKEKSTLGLLEKDVVHCQMTDKYATQDRGNGKSPKFNCDLMQVDSATGKLELVRDKKNKPVKLKVKYSLQTYGMQGVKADSNAEIQAEVMATRLFTAIGFVADKMFAIKVLKCYGCTTDPWNIRSLDQTTLVNPREFSRVSVEFKASGEEIEVGGVEGWSYSEAMDPQAFSTNNDLAKEQLLERQALFILAGMLQHSDNKTDNHRILCDGNLNDRGECSGKIRLMIHDLGFTFGGGTKIAQFPSCFPHCASKAELASWQHVPVWMNEDNRNLCTVNMGFSFAMRHPVVTEEARLFLARLLRKFVDGEDGYRRAVGIFEAAGVEAAGRGKASDWADALIKKVEEIENPALSDNNRELGNPMEMYSRETRADRAAAPALRCDNTIEGVTEKILRRQK